MRPHRPSNHQSTGQSLTEYALIFGFVVLLCVGPLQAIGLSINDMLGELIPFLGGG